MIVIRDKIKAKISVIQQYERLMPEIKTKKPGAWMLRACGMNVVGLTISR